MLATSQEHIHKLALRWNGPFQIIDTVSDFVFKLRLIGNKKGKVHVAHVTRMKRFAGPELQATAELVTAAQHTSHTFEVEAFVDWRLHDNEVHLLVHWLGWDICDRTWEPARSLYEDVPNMVINYLKAVKGEHAKLSDLLHTLQ